MQTTTRRGRWARARRDEIRRLARERLGVTTNQALADRLGIDRANYSRILNGHHAPGGELIASLVDELGATFEEIFTIETWTA